MTQIVHLEDDQTAEVAVEEPFDLADTILAELQDMYEESASYHRSVKSLSAAGLDSTVAAKFKQAQNYQDPENFLFEYMKGLSYLQHEIRAGIEEIAAERARQKSKEKK